MSSAWVGGLLTVFEKLGKVSGDDLLSVTRVRDQLPQSVELYVMFVVSDRNPS